MPNKKLINLIVLATIFSLGHTTDHAIRGDFRWPPTVDSTLAIAISVVIYTTIASGLYFYSKNKIGPGFWVIFGSLGLAFGWLAHFSPFTDQPPQYILSAYESIVAGWLALSCLIGLMLALAAATGYASYLWRIATYEVH
jgi:uncharacterized membrane protein HdeD (DUF308 family)